VLGAVGFVLVGVWGVLNLSEGDWFIGVVMMASAVVGLWSLVVRVLQERRRRVASAAPTSPRSGQVPEPHR
jgi:hypothetical protein